MMRSHLILLTERKTPTVYKLLGQAVMENEILATPEVGRRHKASSSETSSKQSSFNLGGPTRREELLAELEIKLRNAVEVNIVVPLHIRMRLYSEYARLSQSCDRTQCAEYEEEIRDIEYNLDKKVENAVLETLKLFSKPG